MKSIILLSVQNIAVLRLLWSSSYFVPKKLKNREVNLYLCTHHNRSLDECPQTHIIYHEVLYPYVLEQIRALARSMKCRKFNSSICKYAGIYELTMEMVRGVA